MSISIPAPTKGATIGDVPWRWKNLYFNPRTHEGCDRLSGVHPPVLVDFNPRTHEGCDLSSRFAESYDSLFQSPHPRRVRPGGAGKVLRGGAISIPAPTKGATYAFFLHARISFISIPAPTKGATSPGLSGMDGQLNFNPRTHEGCDPTKRDPVIVPPISIPAPTKGATALRSVQRPVVTISIPAPTKGATGPESVHRLAVPGFQSPHPRRVRPCAVRTTIRAELGFQSPHPRRVRLICFDPLAVAELFQSPHPRRVRRFRGHANLLL